MAETSAKTTARTIELTRLLDAPRERVWRALTDVEQLGRWWGPNGFRNTYHEVDIRPGGKLVFTMHGPDGTDYADAMYYEEMVEPERITYRHSGDESLGLEDFQGEITLEDVAGKTRITLRMTMASEEQLKKQIDEVGAVEGGSQTLARLAEYLGAATA